MNIRPLRSFLAALLACCACAATPTPPATARMPATDLNLVVTAPITTWDEAIPLGNGLLGGLLWGETNTLRLSLDRGDLWDERPAPGIRTNDFNYTTMQRLVREGRNDELNAIFDHPYGAAHPTKLPAGRLEILVDPSQQTRAFELNLATAEGYAHFTNGQRLTAFFSAAKAVALVHIPGPEPREIRLLTPLMVARANRGGASAGPESHSVNLLGYPEARHGREARAQWFLQDAAGGLRYCVWVESRRVADGTLLALAVTATSDGPDPLALAGQRAGAALRDGYAAGLRPHLAYWRGFWAQSRVHVPQPDALRHYYLVRYFHGAASRRGAPPMPLQGVWTADAGGLPPWKGDYHNDLNTQMTYLAYLEAGHFEEGAAYLDFLWNRLPVFRKFAREFYAAPGAAVPGVMSLAGQPLGGWGHYSLSPAMGAWSAHLFYLHWRYTGDDRFLRTRAYPWCREVGECLRHLLRADATGALRLPLSTSPEIFDNSARAWLTPNSNYDLACLRMLFLALAEMAEASGERGAAEPWRQTARALGEFQVNAEGALKLDERLELPSSHRHLSNLMPLHPFNLITRDGGDRDRRVIAASLEQWDRLGTKAWCGYSFSWMACLRARAGDAAAALRNLDIYLQGFILRNGFHCNGDQSGRGFSEATYRPFTLEGNFLAMQAVQEMLLQSWSPNPGTGEPGVLRLFPATPAQWADVSFDDLRAEGGHSVSARRANGVTTWVRVVAGRDGLVRIHDAFGGRQPTWSRAGVKRVGDTFEAWLRKGQSLEAAAPPAAAADDWPRYGHDAALTSRSPLHGRLTAPHELWSYSVAGRELALELKPSPGRRRFAAPAAESATPSANRTLFPPPPLMLDVDGSGAPRRVVETFHERWAKVLPGVRGLQRVAWSHTWTDQKVCRLQLFAYDQGFEQPRMVWQSDPPEDNMFQPINLVADLDGDGVPEVCVAAHYRVMIFDGATGRKQTELRYHQSRPYGWFGLADVDGDGRPELVTLGDFQSHLDVLDYDPKKPEAQRLSVRWRRDIEQDIEKRRAWPQMGPRPLVDVTGDRQLELTLNLFNDTGDGQWHVVVLNAATGAMLHDFPRRFLHGAADVDGDGKEELFLGATDGVLAPAFGPIELVALAAGTPRTLYAQPHAAWLSADLPRFGPTWATTASQGMRHVVISSATPGQRPAFFVLERPAGGQAPFLTAVRAVRCDADGHANEAWSVGGLRGEVEAITASPSGADGSPSLLLRLRVPGQTALSLDARSAAVRVVENRPLGLTPAPPIAARLKSGGAMTVVCEGAAQQIVALQSPAAGGGGPRLVWRRPGRGMGDGSRLLGPLAAGLEGPGGNTVVAASQDASGRAVLVAYRHDGSPLWQRRFDQTPGATPVWNAGGLTFWWPGHFRRPGQVDLFVNTRRGLMHSDIGQLLDGRTGGVVWRQEKATVPGQFTWGYLGIPPAVADLDGDGLDDLVSLYPVCFWVADGRTGQLTQGVELASKKRLPAWAAYGEPMVQSFTGQGKPEVLLDSEYLLALLDSRGNPLWHGLGRASYPTTAAEGNASQVTTVKHALVDFAGDGHFVLASAGYGDGVRAIDPRDGHVLWSLAAPTPTCRRVVAADVDGRRGDELLYVAGDRLVAITGDRSAGRLLWEWRGPAALSMPVIADVDGDGLAEILVLAADGTLHCLGASPER